MSGCSCIIVNRVLSARWHQVLMRNVARAITVKLIAIAVGAVAIFKGEPTNFSSDTYLCAVYIRTIIPAV